MGRAYRKQTQRERRQYEFASVVSRVWRNDRIINELLEMLVEVPNNSLIIRSC